MTTKRDYYDILKVNKKAPAAEIKRAYRKLALEYHPDRNKAKDASNKFKEINEAYEVLSDPKKKETYDQFGHAAFDPRYGGFGGADAGSPFGGQARTYRQGPFTYSYTTSSGGSPSGDFDFSDPFEIFEQFFGGASPFRRAAAMPRYGLNLTFMEAAQGCEKKVVIQGKERKIKVPPGVDDGSRIRFDDFYATINVKADKVFKRDGADVFITKEISLKMAILGGKIEAPTIDGEVKLKVRSGTQPGTMIRLRGRGINRLRGFGRGDQYIRLQVKIPNRLSRSQKKALEKLES